MVQKISNRHIQAVMNSLKFIVLDQPTWLRRNLGFWSLDWQRFLRSSHSISFGR